MRPGRDDKVLAAWNGLACRALAEAGRALGRADYVAAAVRNAEFLLGAMRVDGRLMRTWKGGQARMLGYLEDYAMVAAALLDVYEATFDRRWLDEARALAAATCSRLFWDDALRGLLRHRRRRRAADRAAAQSLRQRGALRHLGGDRDAAAPERAHRRVSAYAGACAPGAAARWPT